MDRPLSSILSAPFKPQFHVAFWRSLWVFDKPLEIWWRYVFGGGDYPTTYHVRTPIGRIPATVYSFDDVRTLVECFGKIDYPARADARLIVDVGSNIGLSALFFLSRNDHVHVHLFEPLPANIERLEENLRDFKDRYTLHPVAAGVEHGSADFGWEPTGRYGGLGLTDLSGTIRVEVVDLDKRLGEIIRDGGDIDVLKLDVEGMERTLLDALTPDLLAHIRAVHAETFGDAPDLPGFSRRQWGAITQFEKPA
ncbi:MAG: FkbM family methyltransferase [Alphaproteobacteria bacterium]|nr:FkbM family methyltransferase [Alphaproteobacteria bacterium]